MVSPGPTARAWNTTAYFRLAAAFLPAAIITWGLHEWAHWMAGEALGYDMWITLNQAGPVQGSYDSTNDQILVAMAGPLLTWIQAIVALLIVRRFRQLWTYAFLFLAFWMRALAMGISFMAHPNDEAKASLLLGLPMWILPTVSVLFLLALTFLGSRALKVGWKGNLTAYLAGSFVTAIVIFVNQLLFPG